MEEVKIYINKEKLRKIFRGIENLLDEVYIDPKVFLIAQFSFLTRLDFLFFIDLLYQFGYHRRFVRRLLKVAENGHWSVTNLSFYPGKSSPSSVHLQCVYYVDQLDQRVLFGTHL